MANKIDRKEFLGRVFDVAKRVGALSGDIIEVLASVRWTDAKLVDAIGVEFKLGYVAGKLACDRDRAAKIAAKRDFKPEGKADDSRRTHDEHRAWRAAVSAWSYAKGIAGFDSARNGSKRKPKKRAETATATPATPATPATANAPIDLQNVAFQMPRMESRAECIALALNVSKLLLTAQNRSAKAPWGDLTVVFAEFIGKVRLIAQGVSGNAVTPKVESLPVPAPSVPSPVAEAKMTAIADAMAKAKPAKRKAA